MRFLKKIAAIVLILGILLSLTGCESRQERAYNAAESAAGQRRLCSAAEQFEALGCYEDASQMALYAKAYNAAESGNYDIPQKSGEICRFSACPCRMRKFAL